MSKETLFWPEEIMVWPVAEDLSISEWAAKYRVLGAHSAIKGPYLLEMVPFFAFLMDKIQDPDIQTIVLCKPAQIGGTDACLCVVGYYAHQEGSPIMCVLADQDTAEYVSNEKIKVMLESSETMAALIDSDCYTKTEMKLLNGAYFAIAWATSVAKLASRPIRIVYLDEIDKPGYSLTTREANPISLARERSNTFPDRKHLLTSTPTTEAGNIIRELESCDLIYDWHVPCPACGQYQILRWNKEHCYGLKDGLYRAEDGTMHSVGMVVWEGGTSASNQQIMETARYQCGVCEQSWTTAQKNEAVRRGRGVPRTDPTGWERKVGMHVNRIYSLFDGGRLEEIVTEFIHSRRVPEHERAKALQGFINSALAEPWVHRAKLRKESAILALRDERPRGMVPAEGVLGLTGGGDTQDNGFYYTIYAWGQEDSWLIREGFVESMAVLKEILSGVYLDADGTKYIVNFSLLDAMGHRTAEVYEGLRRVQQIKPAKGEHSMSAPHAISRIDTYPGTQKPIPGGLSLYRVNANYFKDKLHAKLDVSHGDPGAFHFHSEITDDFARQMVAETRNEREQWECPEGRPNHFWDCSYLALAAADIIGISSWRAADAPQTTESQQPPPKKRPEPRTWW